MSRSSHQRQQQQLLAQQQQQMADNDAAAAAAEMFDMFCLATTMRQVLGLHRTMCDTVGLRPAPLNEFYPKLKAKIRSWKAQALWKKFDARASHRAYSKGNACTGTRVLVIGAGPCGLRTAIEAQLLGAKVVVLEKRDRISRNNVLHLWPFVITDLRNLGAKKFYGKFCAGSIDHISIRQLQCILLKVALLLGVEIHEGVSFEQTIEPSEGCGWRAAITPEDHAVSHYEFDVLIGADGKRNTLEAFKRKEFRGKLAIAITANFINKKTEAEAKAEEISGVAFIFNQTFFKELYHTTGIDLENIVYYKDETHYFVMTAKKHSLIDKGVILQDFADPAELLAPANVNTEKLLDYAREAAEFSTKYQMPNLEFAVNHYGKPDVAMFDFTSMFAAESSCRVIVRKNYRLMQCLVGDSLLEPFWPTGSGCARGFLSSMDAAYAIKLWNNPRNSILGVLAQRESIYRLLAQTTPENLQRDIGSYTVDPATRYPNLNRTSVNVWQVKHLIDCDDKAILEQTFMDTNALQASQSETPVRRKRRTGDTLPLSAVLLRWIKAQLHAYEFTQNLNEVSDCFTNGKVLCALINRYRPDLVDFNSVKELPAAESNELAFKILDKELKISRVMTGKDSVELDKIDSKIWLNYLEQICEVFRGEIPHVKHPKLDVSELREKNRNNAPDFSRLLQLSSRKAKSPMQDVADVPHVVQRRSVLDEDKVKRQRKHEPGQAQTDTPRRAKKRRSAEKTTNIEERQQRLKEIEENRQERQSKRRMQRFQQTQNFYKSLHMLQVNTLLRESDESSPFEDYSIYMYRQQAPVFNDRVKELERKLLYPDRERGISSALPRGADEQFSDRIKSMEQRITSRNAYGTDKKPKDLLRAIGKIDSSDWNVREIEKKIEQSKKTETGMKGREKVPKWSKEQFVARQSKMSKPVRQDSGEEKFKEIDQTLKNLDKQLKEGSVLEVGERGKNKVASIAGQFVKKDDTSEEKIPPPLAKSNSKVALAFKKQAASEKCHFCKQTVYLMEKISTEGLILHRSCLKCHHCHTNLRMGGYAFDRDDPEGRFYCTQHFRLPAKAIRPVVRKPGQRKSTAHGSHIANGSDPKTPVKRGIAESVVQLDLLDRGQTPERIEFENTDAMSDGEPSEEHIIDENEWSGRNFLQPSGDSESDLSSSSDESDDDSESEIFEEANGSPIAQQTLQLATDWIGKQHYSNVNTDDSDDDFYDSSEGLIDDGKDDTEGEDFKKAREMRREEVRLQPLPTNLPTDTETEKQTQVVVGSKEDVVLAQKIDDVSSERLNREADEISLNSHGSCQTRPPSKTDIEKIEQNSDRRFSADVDAISEKLYRLNNLMKLNKDIEKVAKDNLVTSDILKKLSLKEKWLLDNSASSPMKVPNVLPVSAVKLEEKSGEKLEVQKEEKGEVDMEKETAKTIGDDDRGDGLLMKSLATSNSDKSLSKPIPSASPAKQQESDQNEKDGSANMMPEIKKVPNTPSESELTKEEQKENVPNMTTDRMEIEGILDIVKMLDNSYIEQSKLPLPKPETSPKSKTKDTGKILYEAEHKNDNRLGDALRQIEVKSFAGTMDTIKSQIVAPTISHQGSMDISKYFPNAKQEKQSSAALNKSQKTLKDVDLTKYFPQSPVPQRKTGVTTVADRLKKSQTEKDLAGAAEAAPKAPPRRQKSMLSGTDKSFSMHEHLLDGAIDIQKAPVVKPVTKKGGIKIVKKIVPKGTKAKKSAAETAKKPKDDADKILDEILQAGQEVRSPSLEYQKLFTDEKSPSEDVSEKIEKILEETGIEFGLPPKPKKLIKTKSLGEEEFKRTQEKVLSKEDGDRPSGVQKILQRFESMSSIKSDESSKLKRTNLMSSTSSSLNKSGENLRSRESLKSNSDSMSDLEKTMEYLKSEWKTEATNFLQKKRDSFYSNLSERKAEAKAEAESEKKTIRTEPQWKQTKYSKFFGVKERSPEKRKSPTKSIAKRKSPAKILKKSPREEIMKHRQKVESVSSRRASFEKKIKGEDVKLKEEVATKQSNSRRPSLEDQIKHENPLEENHDNAKTVDTIQSESLKNIVKESTKPTTNGNSQIPISQNRRDSHKSVELNKNLMDTAQKVLSRRGSASSGLADILKPPVIKGIRVPKEVTPKGKTSQTEDDLEAVIDLVPRTPQTGLNDKHDKSLASNEGSKTEQASKTSPNQSQRGSLGEAETPSSRRGSQNEGKVNQSKIPSRMGSQTKTYHEDEVLVAETPEMPKSKQVSPASLRDVSEKSTQLESPTAICGTETPRKAANPVVSPNQSRRISQTSPVGTSPKFPSRRVSMAEETIQTPPQSLSSRESIAPSVVSRRSSNLSEAFDQALTLDDITNAEEIFNEIINELDKEGRKDVADLPQPATPQEVQLVAVATDLVEETENESQQITKHSRSPVVRKASRASSEDSIEKLFSQFTDDMLVDVEFDSNDEVVAITPRAVLVNEDEDDDEEDEKPITVEEAKLKFEPIFPRQVKNFSQSSSSSMSLSPARSNSKAKQIAKKLDPTNMAPSVQDLLQKIIPREGSEPDNRMPVAFPRYIYHFEEELPASTKSDTQPAETSIKSNENDEQPSKTEHLEVVYELAWPARRRSRSPIPESVRPPVKPTRHVSEKPLSRRGSKELMLPIESIDQLVVSPICTPRRGSVASIKEIDSMKVAANDEPSEIPTPPTAGDSRKASIISTNIERASPALLPTPRRGSRTSTELESASQSTSRRGSKTSLKEDSKTSVSPVLISNSRRNSETLTKVETLPKETDTARNGQSLMLAKTPSPQKESSASKESSLRRESISETNLRRTSPTPIPTPRRTSRSSNEVEEAHAAIEDTTKLLDQELSTTQRVPASREAASMVSTPRKMSVPEKSPSPRETESLPLASAIANNDIIHRQEFEPLKNEASFSPNNQSARSPKDKTLEPTREYRDLLRSRLESPVVDRQSRNPSRSKEKSLEWDMEQLPRSPMPRRKYVDVLLHPRDKEDSPKPIQQTPKPAVQDVPLPIKRLEEWEIIEQLERERRVALIKRDEKYSHQVHETPSSNSTIPIPPLNRLESLDEPQSSKLIEYIKQQTLADSKKQRDDSPKPPSRLKSPQLSSKVSSEGLEKHVEAILQPQKLDSPQLVPKRQHFKKPESTEATYEDFARFTRRSVEKDTETQDSDHFDSASVASNPRWSNYRQKSQESVSGTGSPTSSLAKSVEHLAPARPHRHKPTTTTLATEDKVDRETKYLMDRSKHLRNMKRDFMEEKIAGNNPYLKRVIQAQKVSHDSEDDEDEVDYSLESYRPKNHTTPRFPTSSALSSHRRRREPRYPDFSTTSDYTRRPYTSHFTTPSTTASAGSRHFVDYFKRSPPHYKSRESSKDSCVQSDSETSSAGDVELNSATEISTDSEFDHDEIIREAPKIFIDDTHLRKPTKVQVKQTIITPAAGQPKYHINNRIAHSQQPAKREPQFKPLVQVDQSLLKSNRMPLQNPRPGDYLLNKTASTEGIASKKSLELKKRYLLGEQGNGNKIQKSGSTSILDSKIRSFHSNISECQKLLNPGSDISPSMKNFLDRTKLGENQNDVKNAGDKKIEITIKTTATEEKENVFVNSKNELNKGMEYSETVNTTLVETLSKSKPAPIIETIDLISPEKKVPIIDLTQVEIPPKMLESNMEFIKNLRFSSEDGNSKENCLLPDNKIIDLTLDSPVKSDKTVIEEVIQKPDVSKDIKEAIPDIITHIEEVKLEKKSLLDHEAEKKDSPEKTDFDIQETSIQVPNIPWTPKSSILESDSLSSSSSSSVEDIQHFILDSTTSPDTQTGQIVPRLEVHDSSGTLMQIDSLMIIDGKYIGDPEDLKDMEIPPGIIIPDVPTQSPSPEEPITELRKQDSPLPAPSQKPELKFDTKNENKIDTLKNIPLILEKSEDQNKVIKPLSLNIAENDKKPDEDFDKTPTAEGVNTRGSDSDAEITNQALTETELSDWTADDAISENFIDLEFVLNSNKGTIKRNKKSKKKAPLQSALSITQEPKSEPEPESQPEPCGILKNLDIEEIEFMDTGSEGSCAEAYSATNTALLRNRGYTEYSSGSPKNLSHNQQRLPTEHELKTPVNESPPLPSTSLLTSQKSQSPQLTPPKQSSPSQTQQTQSYSQSLTDSTNDIDEDSLCILTNSQGATANNTATVTITTTTTTEESEALTVVTSPMDSSSPKTQENFQMTGSSSDPNGKTTSPSSNTTTATPATSSSSKGPTRKSSQEDLLSNGNTKRKESEEMSYEEYVRKLQHKITQISNARDSIDVRKQNRRKSSKGEASEANSVIEGNAKGLSVFEGGFSAAIQPKVTLSTISVSASPSQDVHKVPEIPTLSRKLEELTKERTKQKDLIHDLVMDKLQSKKQLNAEKRLNRSRNRSMFGNSLAGSSLSPTPKMSSTNTSPYHIASSSGGDHSGSSCKENNPLVGLKTKISPKDNKDVIQLFADGAPRSAKQRPFSENYDPLIVDDQMCKLSKTQSFTFMGQQRNPFKSDSNGSHSQILKSSVYATPIPSVRMSRKDEAIASAAAAEMLRTEARARARLKSNHDLGLSPEEKLQLLRKRYHLDMQEATGEAIQKSEELRARDRKMIASKSVNDIATVQLMSVPDENSNTTAVRSDLVADFTSDPNLSQASKVTSVSGAAKVTRRQKDPERRKSIIQTFSSFFQKGKKDKDAGLASGTEKSATSSSATTNTGSSDGMFSRFRISPKTKEKSKDKDNGSSPTTPTAASTPQYQHRHPYDQRSNSQDCIAKQKYQMSLYASSPQLFKNTNDEQIPPPIPPLPLNYQRSDDESYATESREQKKQRAISKATRQAELKRLRIAQEIQREQEEIEVQLKDLEARGVLIEKALRGEGQTIDNLEASNMGATDEKLLKELLEIWRNITQLKKRDEELDIRQQELQLEHRHAQLKEELNIRLSGSKLEKSSADVAAEGAILNEMLEIVAKRAALRPTTVVTSPMASGTVGDVANDGITFTGRQSSQIDESDI